MRIDRNQPIPISTNRGYLVENYTEINMK